MVPKEIQSLFPQLRRTLRPSVKEHKTALQHIGEWEDLQDNKHEVMSFNHNCSAITYLRQQLSKDTALQYL